MYNGAVRCIAMVAVYNVPVPVVAGAEYLNYNNERITLISVRSASEPPSRASAQNKTTVESESLAGPKADDDRCHPGGGGDHIDCDR